jgi:hypothetical protein
MNVQMQINLGTHQIDVDHEGETLLVRFTWHKQIAILSWNLTKLEEWAIAAEDDNDYVKAEATFITLAGEKPELWGP